MKPKPRIVYLHQYFRLPSEGGSLRSYKIARALAAAGYQVDVISGWNRPKQETVAVNGFNVHYLPVTYHNGMGAFARIKAFLLFLIKAVQLASTLKPQLIYASSTPLTVGLAALWLKKMKGIPYIFEVRDLWPEAPIQLGYLKNPLFKGMALWAEKAVYKSASHLIALSPGMQAGIKAVYNAAEITVVPNFSDIGYYRAEDHKKRGKELFGKFLKNDRMLISYSGSIGYSNRVLELLNFAAHCQAQPASPFSFIIAGSGAEEEPLKQAARTRNLTDLHFVGSLNRADSAALLAVSGYSYVCFGPWPILETNSPNKFFDALAAGVPPILNIKGWLMDLVTENDCGISYERGRFDYLFTELVRLHQNPDTYKQMKGNAANLAEKFEAGVLCNSIVKIVKQVLPPA